MKVLVTGVAGFIGMHVADRLLARGDEIIGVDNVNAYYDVALKEARLDRLRKQSGFRFVKADIADADALGQVFQREKIQSVIHLAAQAGVRYSLDNPMAYVQSNLVGFVNVLEGCRHSNVEHLVYASSSSIYGGNQKIPFSEHDNADHPISLYAATKKSNELMAHTYSHLFGLPTTGLRFFTVYGPWGRPDMSYFKFTRAILEGRPIEVFNHGKMQRDFTYVDDIAESVVLVLDRPPQAQPGFDAINPDPASSSAPYRIYNIGNHRPIDLMTYINVLERALGREAEKTLLPLQDGDVVCTYADTAALQAHIEYVPTTSVEDGIRRFVDWYCAYYGVKRPAGLK
ncbi:MAG TPA: NAD-dependent epimerase [Burkholderiales bacterium]|nr:NAD-dependent epimerase [Burkholderiales bacterium]